MEKEQWVHYVRNKFYSHGDDWHVVTERIYDAEIAPRDERIASRDRDLEDAHKELFKAGEDVAKKAAHIEVLLKRVDEKDRKIETQDRMIDRCVEQIKYLKGEIARQDAYIEGLERDLRKLKEGWKTVEHVCFTCGGKLTVQESHYCPKCDRGMADVSAESSKPDLPPPMPRIPQCPDKDPACWNCGVEACLRAIYKRLEVK